MQLIEVKTLDYYNNPSIYRFMPEEIFSILEEAFLRDSEVAEVPKILFEEMIHSIKNAELTGLTFRVNTSIIYKN